jgi:pyrroloquinoline quinone (PQQ) biosynthesis protein C
MTDAKEFELSLRKTIDSYYDRDPDLTSYWARFHDGSMPFDECREMYYRRWSSLMTLNRVVLALLLSKAPNLKSRMEAIQIVFPEFGAGGEKSHPEMYRNFLLAMRVPAKDLGWSADTSGAMAPPMVSMVEQLRSMTWIEVLGFMLYVETVGPVIWRREGDVLREKYGLSEDDVEYFYVHNRHDKIDSELLFAQIRREAVTPADREAIVRMLKQGYEVSGARCARWPGTEEYRYVRKFDRRATD